MKFGKTISAARLREDLDGVYLFDYKMAKRQVKIMSQRSFSDESVLDVRVFFANEVERVNENLRTLRGDLGCLDGEEPKPLKHISGSEQLIAVDDAGSQSYEPLRLPAAVWLSQCGSRSVALAVWLSQCASRSVPLAVCLSQCASRSVPLAVCLSQCASRRVLFAVCL